MPEGDTIHKIAGFLEPRLVSAEVQELRIAPRFESRNMNGKRIEAVLARGKHLLIQFDDQVALRSHLGMYGSWHFYRPGAPWRKPASQASLVLETADTVYVCFNAKEVSWIRTPSVPERILDTRLGPDLTAGGADLDQVVRRAREFLEPEDPLVDVLLDQRIAAGIGNVYKSEVLFIQRLHPGLTLSAVDDATLRGCFALAAELLGKNLGGGRRVTRFARDQAGRLWVYGRQGERCLRCDETIRYQRLGRHHRSSYWCERCQQSS